MKKIITALALVLILAFSAILPAFANTPSLTVKIRIEGKTENLFFGEVTTNNKENYSIINMLKLADAQSETLAVTGLSEGYILAVNYDKIGQTEKGLDGFVIRVNGEHVPYANLDSYELKNGDEILVYYSDEWNSGIIRDIIVDTEKIEQGYIRFTYEKPSSDGSFVTNESIVGATVKWYCDEVEFTYVTDGQGGIIIDKPALTSGTHRMNINLYNEDGTPAILRLAPDYTLSVPVAIGDTVAVYVCAAVAVLSLAAIAVLWVSLKRKNRHNIREEANSAELASLLTMFALHQ